MLRIPADCIKAEIVGFFAESRISYTDVSVASILGANASVAHFHFYNSMARTEGKEIRPEYDLNFFSCINY